MDNVPVRPNPETPRAPEAPAAGTVPEAGADWARQIEELKTPEVVLERLGEGQHEGVGAEGVKSAATTVKPPAPGTPAFNIAAMVPVDLSPAGIEKILEKNMAEIYQGLPEYLRPEFRKKGEETASKISVLLQDVKIKIKEIVMLIFEWLKIVPGLNLFFIEKEAAIKAEEILNLYHKQKGGEV